MACSRHRLLACAAAVLALGCGSAQKSAESEENPALARCAAKYARSSVAPAAEMESKLDGALQATLQQWQSELGYAKCANDDAKEAELSAQSIVVLVSHRGQLAALTAAGLSAGFDSAGTVSGQIELRRIRDLAALPDVTFIEAQPVAKPDVH